MAWDYTLTCTLDAGAIPLTDVAGFSIAYGKNEPISGYTAGTCRMELYNNDGKYTPGGGGTHEDETYIGKAFKLTASVDGASYSVGPPVVFQGVIQDVDLQILDTKQSRLIITVVDRLGQLSQINIADSAGAAVPFNGATVDAQINQIMDYQSIGQHNDEVKIVGNATGKSTNQTLSHTGSAGQLAHLLAQTDGGDLCCRQGAAFDASYYGNVLTFKAQGAIPQNTTVTFDDTGAGSTFAFTHLDIGIRGENLVTQAIMQRQGGTAQRARSDSGTITAFGLKGLTRTGLLNADDTGAAALASAIIAKQQKPSTVIKSVQFTITTSDDNGGLFTYTVLDQCDVKYKTPPGTGAQQTYNGMIIGVRWDITPARTVGTFILADAQTQTLFILNNSLYGKLGTGILG